MLCEQCGQREATIHVTQVINGDRTEMNLCGECAQEYGATSFADVSSLLSGLLAGGLGRAQAANALRCADCGMTYSKFKETGMLGCANCYHAFRKQLQPVLKRIHGRLQHEGHIPANAGEGLQLRRLVEVKRRELQGAVDMEEFEKAATLRDELRVLQSKLDAQQATQDADDPPEAQSAATHTTNMSGNTAIDGKEGE